MSIGVIAVYLLAASVNFTELSQAIRAANPMWMILSFLTGLLTYLGAAITLKAYTQEHVPLGQSILVQVAASLVTLVAPAGIGPAALNLRFLQKKNVGTAPAVATVTVVQLAQFITTVISLIALTLITGELGALSMPSSSVMMSIGLAVAAIAAVFLIRPLRAWILTKIQPTVEQIWPRLVWLGTHPRRLAFGFLGSVIMTVAFVACFGFALGAFGYQLPLVTLAVTYLISNSVGSLYRHRAVSDRLKPHSQVVWFWPASRIRLHCLPRFCIGCLRSGVACHWDGLRYALPPNAITFSRLES